MGWSNLPLEIQKLLQKLLTYHFEILCALLHHLETTNHHVPTFTFFVSSNSSYLMCDSLSYTQQQSNQPLLHTQSYHNAFHLLTLFLSQTNHQTHTTHTSIPLFFHHNLPFSSSKNQFFSFPHKEKIIQNSIKINFPSINATLLHLHSLSLSTLLKVKFFIFWWNWNRNWRSGYGYNPQHNRRHEIKISKGGGGGGEGRESGGWWQFTAELLG